jgi:hypothetical protein
LFAKIVELNWIALCSYQVSLPLAEGFQRRRLKGEKDDRQQVMAKAHIAFGKVS